MILLIYFLKHSYDLWFQNEQSTDKEESLDLSDMVPLEGDEEEVRQGEGIKILTQNKLLTRLAILLAQIKAGNNS